MQLKGKKVVVVGLGRTGLATARFLHKKGARVLVADTADETQLGDSVRTLREMGVALELGPHRIALVEPDMEGPAVLRWGRDLYRPETPAPTQRIYTGV